MPAAQAAIAIGEPASNIKIATHRTLRIRDPTCSKSEHNSRGGLLRKPPHDIQQGGFILNRRHFLATLTVIAAASLGSIASAATKTPFDQKAFDAAQAAGKPVLIEVTAPWCPTCKAQAPILSRLKSEPKHKELVSFDIDFDSKKICSGNSTCERKAR